MVEEETITRGNVGMVVADQEVPVAEGSHLVLGVGTAEGRRIGAGVGVLVAGDTEVTAEVQGEIEAGAHGGTEVAVHGGETEVGALPEEEGTGTEVGAGVTVLRPGEIAAEPLPKRALHILLPDLHRTLQLFKKSRQCMVLLLPQQWTEQNQRRTACQVTQFCLALSAARSSVA